MLVRFLTARLGFTGSTIPAVIPTEFRLLLLDLARDKSYIAGGLSERRLIIYAISIELG